MRIGARPPDLTQQQAGRPKKRKALESDDENEDEIEQERKVYIFLLYNCSPLLLCEESEARPR